MYYLTETDPRGAMGLGGKEEDGLGTMGAYLTAIDYKAGKVAFEASLSGNGWQPRQRNADHCRKAAVFRRPGREPCSVRSGRWQDSLALPYWSGLKCTRNIHAGRASIHPGGGKRHLICIHSLLTRLDEFRARATEKHSVNYRPVRQTKANKA